MASPSPIRAFVQWKEATIFSGEEIECVITFKNTARVRDADDDEDNKDKNESKANNNNARANGSLRPRIEQRQRTVTQSSGISGVSRVSRGQFSTTPSLAGTDSRAPSYSRGHRQALSLSIVPSPVTHARNASAQSTPHSTVLATAAPNSSSSAAGAPGASGSRPRPKHSRSLSIMSMGSGSDMRSPGLPQKTPPITGRRPNGTHARSASVQLLGRASTAPSPMIGFPSPRNPPSPLIESEAGTPPLPASYSFPPRENDYLAIRPNRRKPGVSTAPNTPAIVLPPSSPPPPFATDFAFPPRTSPSNVSHITTPDFEFPPRDPMNVPKPSRMTSHERLTTANSLNPVARVLSEASANGGSRTSSEFYSLDNNSSDTNSSETPAQMSARLLPKAATNSRKSSRSRSNGSPDAEPEVLMMGYAQTMGSFVLDASLVNQTPFDEVKRKGVLGGQGGGGVVGIESRSKRESGFFGSFTSFGWGNVGESLGGLLGGGEMSSIKEMRNVASTKTIPLLSTPQSILFVDLRLAPGQSRSYTYRFQLPRGLPPTHKGRAIKVQYHIKIGVQRSGTLGGHQNVKHIEVPFRVLGSVNNRGESLGHDLMSPYILLHDRSRTASIPTPEQQSLILPPSYFESASSSSANTPSKQPSNAALDDLVHYAELLLAQKSGPTTEPLLSPTTEQMPRRRSSVDDTPPSTVKAAIDLAIMRSNLSTSLGPSSEPSQSQSTNRFTIARSGQFVAVFSVVRPAYRLGETIVGVIDFRPPVPDTPHSSRTKSRVSTIPTYALSISLESLEHVEPSLALRSASSISRATRKCHAQVVENVLFARQTGFRLEIPMSATPGFETTGVGLKWRIRVEFVTGRAGVVVDNEQMYRQRAPKESKRRKKREEGVGLGISEGRNAADIDENNRNDDEAEEYDEKTGAVIAKRPRPPRRQSTRNGQEEKSGQTHVRERSLHERQVDCHDRDTNPSRGLNGASRTHAPRDNEDNEREDIDSADSDDPDQDESEEAIQQQDDLLEEVQRDDRGVVLIAKEKLLAETFEVAIPIKVFGATSSSSSSGVAGSTATGQATTTSTGWGGSGSGNNGLSGDGEGGPTASADGILVLAEPYEI
ncbi:hypothetical protein AAFC00_001992 [Neodothiora populina]|uniref:Rgp1-domain-containing protein n=1 Tax=Neodothiora populina TaxID=2781224 RepID=A0ABR3PFZ9_9PEZI